MTGPAVHLIQNSLTVNGHGDGLSHPHIIRRLHILVKDVEITSRLRACHQIILVGVIFQEIAQLGGGTAQIHNIQLPVLVHQLLSILVRNLDHLNAVQLRRSLKIIVVAHHGQLVIEHPVRHLKRAGPHGHLGIDPKLIPRCLRGLPVVDGAGRRGQIG